MYRIYFICMHHTNICQPLTCGTPTKKKARDVGLTASFLGPALCLIGATGDPPRICPLLSLPTAVNGINDRQGLGWWPQCCPGMSETRWVYFRSFRCSFPCFRFIFFRSEFYLFYAVDVVNPPPGWGDPTPPIWPSRTALVGPWNYGLDLDQARSDFGLK